MANPVKRGFKYSDGVKIVSDLSTVEQTSAAADADHAKIAADIAAIVAEQNKVKALLDKLLGTS
jgi:hypothetical protein